MAYYTLNCSSPSPLHLCNNCEFYFANKYYSLFSQTKNVFFKKARANEKRQTKKIHIRKKRADNFLICIKFRVLGGVL